MQLPEVLESNLKLLFAEVYSQLKTLQQLHNQPSVMLADSLQQRRGYSKSLQLKIHEIVAESLLKSTQPVQQLHVLRMADALTTSLERLLDDLEEVVWHVRQFDSHVALKKMPLTGMLEQVIRGLMQVEKLLAGKAHNKLEKIWHAQLEAQKLHGQFYANRLKHIRKFKNPVDVLNTLQIANRVLQMANYPVDMTEKLIANRIGQSLRLGGFLSLQSAMANMQGCDLSIQSVAQTRSGAAVSGITQADSNQCLAIFKNGSQAKLKAEKKQVKNWQRLFPGLAPQILDYQRKGEQASLLIEYLEGRTFDNVLLNGSEAELKAAFESLMLTLKNTWSKTQKTTELPLTHMDQLKKRLPLVLEVHRHFNRPAGAIAGQKVVAIEELIEHASLIENNLRVPFTVRIHGDFNIDNIIYDAARNTLHYIDLHRSRQSDYVQDIAVFMVSNYRLQVFDWQTRQRITRVCLEIFRFAREFAKQHKDTYFELRLLLGLVRSFITSTRFIMDKTLAGDMFLRAVYLLESLYSLDEGELAGYRLPVKELFL